jgi:tetratricopeptide (TPR) repeat protein
MLDATRRLGAAGVRCAAILALAFGLLAGASGAGRAADPADQAAYDAAFDAMQKDPGNSDKALAYAQAAIKIGDLEGAISALERLLIFNPDLPRLQVEVGVLYFRLGSYDLARGYLAPLAERPDVPDDVRATAREYLAQIDQRASPHHFGGNLTTGFRYQTNATFGTSSNTFVILGAPFPIPNNVVTKPDANFFGLGTLNYVYDFQRADPLTVEANLTLFGQKQFRETQFDLSLTQLDVGPRIGLPWLTEGSSIRPYLIGDFLSLGGASYIDSYGGGLNYFTPVTERIGIDANFEIQNRQYPVNPGIPRVENQTGDYISVRATPHYSITPDQIVAVLGELDRGMAVQGYQRYMQYVIGPYYRARFDAPFQPFVQPWTGTIGFTRIWRNYGAPDVLIDPNDTRNDREWHLGASLEIGIVERITAVLQIERAWVDSTIPNYAYRNLTGVAGLSFTF